MKTIQVQCVSTAVSTLLMGTLLSLSSLVTFPAQADTLDADATAAPIEQPATTDEALDPNLQIADILDALAAELRGNGIVETPNNLIPLIVDEQIGQPETPVVEQDEN